MHPTSASLDQVSPGELHQVSRPGWFARNPEVRIAVLLFITSNLLIATFAAFTHWQLGTRRINPVDFCRWDCAWFSMIVDGGYDATANRGPHGDRADWAFFPLFPATALPLRYLLGLSTPLALVLASRIALFFAILSFLFLIRDEVLDDSERFAAGALVAFNPYLIYAYTGYSEPLYFTLTALGFVLLRKNAWLPAGLAGAFVSATRIVGSLFALAYLARVAQVGLKRVLRQQTLAVIGGLALCPAGFLLYAAYLHRHTGDALAFLHVQAAFGRHIGNPLQVLSENLRAHHWQRLWGSMGVGGLMAAAWLFRQRRSDLAIFLVAAILVPLSADTWGFARYLWWQPPLLFAIFTFLKRYRRAWIIYFAFSGGMIVFMLIQWFSTTNIVV